MDDAINLFILHQLVERIKVADVHLHELIVWLVLDIFEVSQAASIGQLVEVDDVVLRVLVYKEADYMATDKASTTGITIFFSLIYFFKLAIHFLSDSVQYGTLIPNTSITLVLSSTLYEGLVTGLGNSFE